MKTAGRNSPQVREAENYAVEHNVDLRTIELDVSSERSCNAAIQKIISKNGRLDVVVHNAGHMVFGPAEAFTPEQFAELYDINVLSTQRVNRSALPQLRSNGTRAAGLGIEQQRRRRNAALSRAIFCSEGGHGCPGRPVCP